MRTALFYRHYAGDPYRNMAIDEWLFGQGMVRPGMVALRLYSWRPGAITFGYNQRFERAVRHELLSETPLIRRVTGGRALYHDLSEATYAVVVNAEGGERSRLSGSIAETSAAIASALTVLLGRLGVESQYLRQTVQAEHGPEYFHTAPCFASAARHEVVADGRKVVASAQRRIGSTLLQHGSIKLGGVAYHPALDGPDCPAGRSREIDPLLAQRFDDVGVHFEAVMAEELDLKCEEACFSAEEEGAIDRWTERVARKSVFRRNILKQGDVDASQ